MLTFNQCDRKQAALFAACPRPRALTSLALTLPASSPRAGGTAASLVVAPSAGFGAVAAVRPYAGERPSFGYGRWLGGMSGLRRGSAAVQVGAGAEAELSMRDQQDKHDLTNRRGPRPWRPPH